MCSLGEYVNRQIEAREMIDRKSIMLDNHTQKTIGTEHTNFLMGAIILDAIFHPLHQYLNILINTESDADYSTDEPFDYIRKFTESLDVVLPLESIRRHNALGNPSNNIKSFFKFIQIDEFTHGKKGQSQRKAQIYLNKGLHLFLTNISVVLDFIVASKSNPKYIQIRNLFFFYIANINFQLLKNHLYHDRIEDFDFRPFTTLYINYINSESNENGNKLRTRSLVSSIYKKEISSDWAKKNFGIIVKSVAEYIEKNLDIMVDNNLWESISKINYVNEFLEIGIIINIIKELLDLYKNNYIAENGKKYVGNMNYVEDVYPVMFGNDGDDLFFENQKSSTFYKNRDEDQEIIRRIERRRRLIEIESNVIENPFIEFRIDPSCKGCLFHLYKYPMSKLPKKIEPAIKSLVKCWNKIEELVKKYNGTKWYDGEEANTYETYDMFLEICSDEKWDFNTLKSAYSNKSSNNRNIGIDECDKQLFSMDKRTIENTFYYLSPLLDIQYIENEDLKIAKSSMGLVPFFTKQSIREWKLYFKYFCKPQELKIANGLIQNNVFDGNGEHCYKQFLSILRKKFILNMITEIKSFGYVNDV